MRGGITLAQLGGETLNITMRPGSFDDIIGLEQQVAAIKKQIENGVPRAFLLSGPFGCGKTTLAYIIAKYVQGWDFTGSPQVQEVNAADVTGIDNMRKLVDDSGSYPMVGKYGVIILDEAHKLSKQAQECLLKVFEDPNSPTIWIIATTDPDKLIPGIRAGRCFTVAVEPMGEKNMRILVQRAVEATQHEGDVEPFIKAALKAQLGSPRKILMSFQGFHAGIPAEQACASQTIGILPEYFDIARAVVYGKWDSSAEIWGSTVPAVGAMLKELDDKLKKKSASADTEEQEGQIDEDDAMSKPEIARGLRIIVAGFLKGAVLPSITKGKQYKFKQEASANKAYKAMHVLANTVPAGSFDIEWAGLIVTLFRVNQIMQGKQ
jgi:DNA polymerase III delta prime subunit